MRRAALVLVAVLAAGGGVAYYMAPPAGPAPPPVPDVPPEWADPPMVELVTAKRRAVLADPRNGTAWGELGMAFDAHERSAEAIACYRAAAALAPTDARWPFLLAEQLNWRSKGEMDKEEAVRLYRASLDRQAPSPAHRAAAELSLADLLAELGRQSEAEPIYERVYAADRSNPWAAFRVGTAAADRGDEATAGRVLMTLARNPFAQKKAAAALAALHRRAGRMKAAEGFEYAASLLPPDMTWLNPCGEEVGEYQRGRRALVEAVTQAEGHGDYRAAAAAARRLSDLYPGPQTQLMLGRSLVSKGDFETAIPVLEDSIHADPKLVMAHAFLGMAWFGRGERADAAGLRAVADGYYAKAVAALDRAVGLKSDYAPGYLYRARALKRLGRVDDAVRSAREFIARRPEEWEGYVVLGDVLAAAGKKDEAIAAVEQGVKLANPNEPRPRQALEKLKAGK